MSDGFKLDWSVSKDFDDPILSLAQEKRVLRAAGAKLATRLRRRLRASGLRESGQLANSIKFRVKKGPAVVGFLAPRGVRKDADTHKTRKPMRNFSIAAFQAAKGREILSLDAGEEDAFVADLEKQIEVEMKRNAIEAVGGRLSGGEIIANEREDWE